MARSRNREDEEASASSDLPAPGPVSNLTAYERAQIAQQATIRQETAESERIRKQHERKTDADLAAVHSVLADKVKALLEEHYKDDPTAEDTVAHMMRQINPVLAAGKEGGRRERTRFMRPIAAKPKAAA